LTIDSEPDLPLATIAINVQLRSHEVADPSLTAARVMFRRAANHIARIEDTLIVDGWDPGLPPPPTVAGIPPVYTVHVARKTTGLLSAVGAQAVASPIPDGKALVSAVVKAIGLLEQAGQGGPYACVLGMDLFEISTDPTGNLVMPRDRILPFLQGPLLRSSALPAGKGVVVALSGNPIEIVVASDIGVRYLQTTLEPRYVFRVAERVALRIKETSAIAILTK
jgi:hypothetical protein